MSGQEVLQEVPSKNLGLAHDKHAAVLILSHVLQLAAASHDGLHVRSDSSPKLPSEQLSTQTSPSAYFGAMQLQLFPFNI